MHDNLTITLCGSARFERMFRVLDKSLTLCGHTVFSLSVLPSMHGRKDWCDARAKELLDAAHLRKIDRSDAIVLINQFGYIGESTLREVEYATATQRRIYALESWGEGLGIGRGHTDEVRRLAALHGVPVPYRSPINTSHLWSVWDLLGPAGRLRSSCVDEINAAAGREPWPGAVPGGSNV